MCLLQQITRDADDIKCHFVFTQCRRYLFWCDTSDTDDTGKWSKRRLIDSVSLAYEHFIYKMIIIIYNTMVIINIKWSLLLTETDLCVGYS